MSFEILNDLIDEVFGVQLIEPKAKFFYKTKVKLKDGGVWKDDTVIGDYKSRRGGGSGRLGKKGGNKLKEEIERKKRERMLKGLS